MQDQICKTQTTVYKTKTKTVFLLCLRPGLGIRSKSQTTTLLSSGVKYSVVGKDLRFSTKISVNLGNGTRKAHGYYRSLIASHLVADRSVSVPLTLSDLERLDVKGQIFLAYPIIMPVCTGVGSGGYAGDLTTPTIYVGY